MKDKYIIIAFFAISFLVVVIVEFLGNKLTDKAENALRAKRYQRMKAEDRQIGPSESLAARMEQAGYGAKRVEQKAKFCSSCGEGLKETARFCPKCGRAQDTFKTTSGS